MLHDFLALMYSMAGVSVGACGRLNGAPIPRGMKGRTVHFGWPMDLVLKESHFDEKLVYLSIRAFRKNVCFLSMRDRESSYQEFASAVVGSVI